MLRRLDAAVMPIINAKKDGQDRDVENEAGADDVEGVKGIMGILRARSKAVFGKPANDAP